MAFGVFDHGLSFSRIDSRVPLADLKVDATWKLAQSVYPWSVQKWAVGNKRIYFTTALGALGGYQKGIDSTTLGGQGERHEIGPTLTATIEDMFIAEGALYYKYKYSNGFAAYRAPLSEDGSATSVEQLFTQSELLTACSGDILSDVSLAVHGGTIYVGVRCGVLGRSSVFVFDPGSQTRWTRLMDDVSRPRWLYVDDSFIYVVSDLNLGLSDPTRPSQRASVVRYARQTVTRHEVLWDQGGSIVGAAFGQNHICWVTMLPFSSDALVRDVPDVEPRKKGPQPPACDRHQALICKDKRTSVGDDLLRVFGRHNSRIESPNLSGDRVFFLSQEGKERVTLHAADLPAP